MYGAVEFLKESRDMMDTSVEVLAPAYSHCFNDLLNISGHIWQFKLKNCRFDTIIFHQSLSRKLMHRTLLDCGRASNKFNYSVFFMKGTDSRLLNHSQQLQFTQMVNKEPLSSSFLVYNSHQVKNKLFNWYSKLPWIRPYYAIKANPINCLLKQLTQAGAGLDCASKSEIKSALDLGLKPSDIVYSNPIKDQNDLKWAESNGIKLTTADTIDQLQKIKQLAPNMKILWRISITQESTDKLATPFSGKFGDDIDSEVKIHARMKQIRDMGIKLQGIHFHCGSGQHGSSAFKRAVILARSCLQIGRKYNHNMQTLDVGGGFPSGDLNPSTIQALQLTKDDPLGYKIMAEPGRHFSAYSCYLLARIIGKRTKSGKTCFHLNQSLYHSFNCNIMDGVSFENSNQFYSKVESDGRIVDVGKTENSTLFGMTCDGLDVITKNIQVPSEMNVSDWICLSGMGAYTYGPRSTFNGMNSTQKIVYWEGEIAKQEISNGLPITI